jgi:hypothetical protein
MTRILRIDMIKVSLSLTFEMSLNVQFSNEMSNTCPIGHVREKTSGGRIVGAMSRHKTLVLPKVLTFERVISVVGGIAECQLWIAMDFVDGPTSALLADLYPAGMAADEGATIRARRHGVCSGRSCG